MFSNVGSGVGILQVTSKFVMVGAFLAQSSKYSESKSELDIVAYFSQRFQHGQRHHSASMNERCRVDLALAYSLTHLYMQGISYMLTRWAIAPKEMTLPISTSQKNRMLYPTHCRDCLEK